MKSIHVAWRRTYRPLFLAIIFVLWSSSAFYTSAVGARVVGISSATSDGSTVFLPLQSIKLPHEVSFNDLSPILRSVVEHILTANEPELIRVVHTRYMVGLSTQTTETVASAPSGIFVDVWQAESICRPGYMVTWHDLWGEFPVEASDIRHMSLQLVLDVPGEASLGDGAFGSAIQPTGDPATKWPGAAAVWSWSGWYVKPGEQRVGLRAEPDGETCLEPTNLVPMHVDETASSAAWSQATEELGASRVSLPLVMAVDEEGGVSLGSIGIVTGKLGDANTATDWAHHLAGWTRGEGEPRASLQVEAILETAIVASGDTISYGYQLVNIGAGSAQNVAMELPLPTALRYITDSAIPSHGMVSWDADAHCLNWQLDTSLPPGGIATLSLRVEVQ